MALSNNNKLYYPSALLNTLLFEHQRDWAAELE